MIGHRCVIYGEDRYGYGGDIGIGISTVSLEREGVGSVIIVRRGIGDGGGCPA